MASKIHEEPPVMVTGANGYVAGWIVKRLLEEGHTVHAAVRDPGASEKLAHLDDIAAGSSGTLRYFAADLLLDGSYDDAAWGCGTIFHTASPVAFAVDDPQRDLIDPAVLGTRNVLGAAGRTPTVTRVVLTSSCAAISGDNADIRNTPGEAFTEDDWNTTSSPVHQPYAFSKVMAEREAWTIAGEQDQWDLVVLNPGLVIGPALNPFGTSGSIGFACRIGDGSLRDGMPRWGFGVVDVRDLAEAHLKAAFIPDAKGRYIIVGHCSDLFDLAGLLLDKYGDTFPIPRKALSKWRLWLAGPTRNGGMSRKAVCRNVGLPWVGDNSKSVRELGLAYRPLRASMEECFQQMIDSGQLTARSLEDG